MSKRKRSEPVERQYVIEVVNTYWPHAQFRQFNFPITPIDPEFKRQFPSASEKSFTKYRRYCDAVVVTTKELMLIEAKIRRPIDGLGQLLLYRYYAPFVPELKPYLHLPIIPTLVTPKKDPFLIPVCKSNGFRYLIVPTEQSTKYLQDKGFV